MSYPNPVGVCETEKVKEGFGCMTSSGKETFPQSSHKACCQKVNRERKKEKKFNTPDEKSTFLISVQSHSRNDNSNQIFNSEAKWWTNERIGEKMLSCLSGTCECLRWAWCSAMNWHYIQGELLPHKLCSWDRLSIDSHPDKDKWLLKMNEWYFIIWKLHRTILLSLNHPN